MNHNLKILVVCGGTSTEREISLKSGAAVLAALQSEGYRNASLFDLNEKNAAEILRTKPDIAYIALHGAGGEDGRIQGFLEEMKIPYTGPGIEASAVCMNKIITKQILQNRAISTPAFQVLTKKEFEENQEKILASLSYPIVLKSPKQGSSIGVVIAASEKEVLDRIDSVFALDDEMMLEEFIGGMELTVPVLGNEEIEILPIIEITSENEFYDFESKYTPGMCHHIIPARISEETAEKIRSLAEKSYRALRCRGLSRIDFMLSEQGEPFVIEVNTSPGMTEMSLFPDSAKHIGLSFGKLCEKIVSLGLEK